MFLKVVRNIGADLLPIGAQTSRRSLPTCRGFFWTWLRTFPKRFYPAYKTKEGIAKNRFPEVGGDPLLSTIHSWCANWSPRFI